MSTAYYAMFHSLAQACSDTLVGTSGAARSKPAWRQTYRALDHGVAKNACKECRNKNFPNEILDFANVFYGMQENRHAADYDPHARFKKSQVNQAIETAKQAIVDFRAAPLSDRRAFCVLVMFKQRGP